MQNRFHSLDVVVAIVVGLVALIVGTMCLWLLVSRGLRGWYIALLCTCFVPGIVYIPVRMVLGTSPLTFESQRLKVVFQGILSAYISGIYSTVGAYFIYLVLMIVIGLAEAVFSISIIPREDIKFVYLPLVCAAFAAGATWTAFHDVKKEQER